MHDLFTHKVSELHEEVTNLIADHLSPIALKYHYSDVNLETKVKWKPFVLLLGNYSSGKSTLINDFIGYPIQNTGQAPTDDSFTVITGEDQGEKIESEDNKIIRAWKSAGILPGAALESQALLELQKIYCDKKQCLRCELGNYVLGRN